MIAHTKARKKKSNALSLFSSLFRKYGTDERSYCEFIVSVNADSLDDLAFIQGLSPHKYVLLDQSMGWIPCSDASLICVEDRNKESRPKTIEEEIALSQHSQFEASQERLSTNWILYLYDFDSLSHTPKKRMLTKRRLQNLLSNHAKLLAKEKGTVITLSPPVRGSGWMDCWALQHKSILANARLPAEEGQFFRKYLKQHAVLRTSKLANKKTYPRTPPTLMKDKHTFFELTMSVGSQSCAWAPALFYGFLFDPALAVKLKYNFMHSEVTVCNQHIEQVKIVVSLDTNMWAQCFMRIWRDHALKKQTVAEDRCLWALLLDSSALKNNRVELQYLTKLKYQTFRRSKASEFAEFMRQRGEAMARTFYWDCGITKAGAAEQTIAFHAVRHGFFGFVPCYSLYAERPVFEIYCLFTIEYTELLEKSGAFNSQMFCVSDFFLEDPKSLWPWCDTVWIQEVLQQEQQPVDSLGFHGFQDVKQKRYVLGLTLLQSKLPKKRNAMGSTFASTSTYTPIKPVQMPLHALLMRVQRNVNPKTMEFFNQGNGIMLKNPFF